VAKKIRSYVIHVLVTVGLGFATLPGNSHHPIEHEDAEASEVDGSTPGGAGGILGGAGLLLLIVAVVVMVAYCSRTQ
jgi:hypothetical protein